MDRHSRGVAQVFAQSDLCFFREAVRWNFPGFEVLVHIGIEVQLAGLHEAHDRHGRYRLADRRGVEERFGSHWRATYSSQLRVPSPIGFLRRE